MRSSLFWIFGGSSKAQMAKLPRAEVTLPLPEFLKKYLHTNFLRLSNLPYQIGLFFLRILNKFHC